MMVDLTETTRRAMLASEEIQADLEKAVKHWDTDQLRAEFDVIGFLAPFVTVRRRADGKVGSMKFSHSPRVYFDWEEDKP